MVILIGERLNMPRGSMPPERLAYWHRRWKHNPIYSVRHCPAMVFGQTKERLLDITSIKPRLVTVVNLLPPSEQCGSWDSELAERVTMKLLTWLHTGDHDWERVIMLGKRVSCELTDRQHCEFGTVYPLTGGVPALCFPHPSGRSRYLNDMEYRAQARLWARKFMKGIK